jgi:hypothetical protein
MQAIVTLAAHRLDKFISIENVRIDCPIYPRYNRSTDSETSTKSVLAKDQH